MQTVFIESIKKIIKKHGTGYYRATFLFPKKIREEVWTLYTFLRLADEIVDTQTDVTLASKELTAWQEEWTSVLTGKRQEDTYAIFREMKVLHDAHHIPHEYSEVFLECMKQDLSVARYATYTDLEKYMYGSAVIVGYMMSHIIGFADGALPHARALGEAMQITNFLRDVREDYELRNRIYIPEEDMKKFGVTEDHIKNHVVDNAWIALMRYQINRARMLYVQGNAGIALLDKKGRKAIFAASRIYEGILGKIEQHNYDVFTKRTTVNPFTKTLILIKTLCNNNL